MAQTYKEPDDYLSKKAEHKVSPIDDSDKEFWNGLYEYLNIKHNNIINIITKTTDIFLTFSLFLINLVKCIINKHIIAVYIIGINGIVKISINDITTFIKFKLRADT